MAHPKEYLPFAVLVILILFSFILIKPFVLALFLGAILAYITHPVYAWVARKVKYKSLASFLVCFLVILLITVPAFFLVKALVQESYVMFIVIKQKLAVGLFQNCHNQFCQFVEQKVNNPQVIHTIQELSKNASTWIVQRGSNFLVSIPHVFLNLFIIFFSMFYFLRDSERLTSRIKVLLDTHSKSYTLIAGRVHEIVRGILYGYLLVALIEGAAGALGFFIFGISSPLLWGIVLAFATFVPMLGSSIVWVPAAVILFLNGMFQDSSLIMLQGAGLFIYGLLIIGGIDNFLRPKLIGDRAKIHPLVILLGILGGVILVGPLGLLLGPLILALTLFIFDLYVPRNGS